MTDTKADFESYMRQLQEFDPEIIHELSNAKNVESIAESTDRTMALQPETIVLTKGRPVLDIKRGAAVIEFDDIESEIWRT